MLRTFNMGIGMVLVVSPRLQSKVERVLRRRRMKFHEIGEVVRKSRHGREGRQSVRYGGGWR
jgi:phosphoribosylaminoimidazole (AIR) synthetase